MLEWVDCSVQMTYASLVTFKGVEWLCRNTKVLFLVEELTQLSRHSSLKTRQDRQSILQFIAGLDNYRYCSAKPMYVFCPQ